MYNNLQLQNAMIHVIMDNIIACLDEIEIVSSSTFFSAGFRLTDHRVDQLLQTFIVDVVLSPLRRKMRHERLRESHPQ